MPSPRSAAAADQPAPNSTASQPARGTAGSAAPKSRPQRTRRARPRPVGVNTTGWSLVGTHDLVELCRLVHSTASRQMDSTIFFLGLYDGASQTVEVVWQIEDGVELPGGS